MCKSLYDNNVTFSLFDLKSCYNIFLIMTRSMYRDNCIGNTCIDIGIAFTYLSKVSYIGIVLWLYVTY